MDEQNQAPVPSSIPPTSKNYKVLIITTAILALVLIAVVAVAFFYRSQITILFGGKSEAVLNAEEDFRSNYNINRTDVPDYEGTSPAQVGSLSSLSMALKDYQNKNGKYPEALSELSSLVPKEFYQSISIDPYSNEPFRYEMIENGTNYKLCAKTPTGWYCTGQAWLLDTSSRSLE